MEGEHIAFKYKDNKTKDSNNKPIEREMELNYRDFFPRLLQHVPPKYFRLVRYYGLYSNRANIPKEFLYNETENQETKMQDNWEILQLEKTGTNPLICQTCQKRKVYIFTKLKNRRNNKTIIFKRMHLNKIKFREEVAA